jgi:hemerythrin-like domain-containing protein
MNKPQQRHPSLVPLSQDHHDGLLLAVRLQQGTRALQRLWSHDFFWQAEYVVMFYDDHLTSHFDAEEIVLFPVAQQYLEKDAKIVERLLYDHNEMRTLVNFFRAPRKNELEAKLKHFGKILEDHIRCEERELFPLCEKRFPSDLWKNIESQLSNYYPRKQHESNNQ